MVATVPSQWTFCQGRLSRKSGLDLEPGKWKDAPDISSIVVPQKQDTTKPKTRTRGEPWALQGFMLATRDRLHSGASCWPADAAILAHLLATLGALCRLARFGHFCRLGTLVTFSVHRHDTNAVGHLILVVPIVPFHPTLRSISQACICHLSRAAAADLAYNLRQEALRKNLISFPLAQN